MVLRHVTVKKELLTFYTPCAFELLKMNSDGVSKVIGVGDVCLKNNTINNFS